MIYVLLAMLHFANCHGILYFDAEKCNHKYREEFISRSLWHQRMSNTNMENSIPPMNNIVSSVI